MTHGWLILLDFANMGFHIFRTIFHVLKIEKKMLTGTDNMILSDSLCKNGIDRLITVRLKTVYFLL